MSQTFVKVFGTQKWKFSHNPRINIKSGIYKFQVWFSSSLQTIIFCRYFILFAADNGIFSVLKLSGLIHFFNTRVNLTTLAKQHYVSSYLLTEI